jgi:hypothetical protein
MPKEAQDLFSLKEKESLNKILQDFISDSPKTVPKKGSRQVDWLLLLTGGAFVALLSSGLKPPITWEVKILLGFMLASSILGVVLWFVRLDTLDEELFLRLNREMDRFHEEAAKEPDVKKRNLKTLYFTLFLLKGFAAAFGEAMPKKSARILSQVATTGDTYLMLGLRGEEISEAKFAPINQEAEILKRELTIQWWAKLQAAILFIGFLIYAALLLWR